MTKFNIITIFIISLIYFSQSSSVFNRVVLGKSSLSLCLDGSPGAYYISQGSGINITKFVIWFEGVDWCGGQDISQTLQNCYKKSNTDFGSSLKYPPTISLNQNGILSGDININSHFYDWNRVLLKDCDSSGHQGTRQNPVNYKGKDLYFRGQNITIGQFTALNFTHKIFTQATEILLTGGLAGGLAAYQWTNYISNNSKARVWTAPDSGIFIDIPDYNKKIFLIRNQFINLMKFSNAEVETPVQDCNKKYKNQIWRCMFAQNIIEFIKTPLFSINSLYSIYGISTVLGIKCISYSSLKQCSDQEINEIQKYKQNMKNILNQIVLKSQQNGAWAPACVDDTYIDKNNYWVGIDYRVPQNSVYSIQYSLKNWILKTNITNNHIDKVEWPLNKPCSGQMLNKIRKEKIQ